MSPLLLTLTTGLIVMFILTLTQDKTTTTFVQAIASCTAGPGDDCGGSTCCNYGFQCNT
jgi:hypothetical protein